jgi:UDP-glucose 4-epimerase
MKNRRIVITGGAGFIGSNLAHKLVEDNEVTILDDLSTGRIENIADIVSSKKVKFIQGSILDKDLLDKTFKGIDFVLHQAAITSVPRSIENPLRSNEVNINGTLNVLLSARDNKIEKVVFASSSSVYGDTKVLPKTETMPVNPLSPYALTKATGEYYCLIFNKVFGLPTACLRYFNVFGPRQNPNSEYAAVIPKFILNTINNKPSIIYGDGNQTRDFTYVADVVQANIKAAESSATGVFNIGSGRNITINGLVNSIMSIMQKNLLPLYKETRAGDVKDSLADISKARSFDYLPEYSLETGLKETIRRFPNI